MKWYKIHMVQPVPPVTLSCQGTPAGGEGDGDSGVGRSWQAQSGAGPRGGPRVLVPGSRQGGKTGSLRVRVPGAPIMCSVGTVGQDMPP